MNESRISIRIDKTTKQNAEKVFDKVGLSMSSAVTLFLKRCINYKGIPFDVTYEPNAETKQAINDVKNRKNLSKKFDNFDDLMESLNA